MPAANLLTDDGHLAISSDSGPSQQTLRVGAQDVSTMENGDSAGYCNVHVAMLFLLAVGFVVLLRRSGIHALALEG